MAPEDITLARLDEVGPIAPGHADSSLIWADVLGQARRNARPVARYLVFMIVAGVIAAFGVIEVNSILIVGAMAVSPDVLPVTAACVGLVSRRYRLAWRAIVTLVIGLGATCVAAVALAAGLDILGILPSGFNLDESALSGLTTVNDATVGVALAAGIAGMLALETRASSAVGVAISITTIPAAAYFGVAVAVGEMGKAWGALAVLGVNVVMLLVAGTATLIVQRRLGLTTGSRQGQGTECFAGTPLFVRRERRSSRPAALIARRQQGADQPADRYEEPRMNHTQWPFLSDMMPRVTSSTR